MDRNKRGKKSMMFINNQNRNQFFLGGSDEGKTGRFKGKAQPMCCFLAENQGGSLYWDVMLRIIIRVKF